MKIRQIEIYQSPIKLREPFIISLGQVDYAENILVVIRTDNGLTGYGECSPFKTIQGESMETCYVVGRYLGKVLLGMDPRNMKECSMRMDGIIYGNTSIKSAFDMALYDIASQHSGMPLYQYLGGNNHKTIATDYTVSISNAEKMAQDAKRIKSGGFQVIKVKLGGSKEQDVERIRLIREAIGPGLPVRIDANQGWTAETALEILRNLAPYDIQHCEEPIPRWDFMKLPEIRSKSPIPIMADESCCDHHDARRLIDLGACDSLNIKLGKSSGIFKALQIIHLAEEAKIPAQIGGFLESRLGFTASAHLALVTANIRYYDFDTPLMFVEDPVLGGITYGNKGTITVPEKPGLGASADPGYLKGLTHCTIN
jgi:L-Ala-D/L-Glu epimerase